MEGKHDEAKDREDSIARVDELLEQARRMMADPGLKPVHTREQLLSIIQEWYFNVSGLQFGICLTDTEASSLFHCCSATSSNDNPRLTHTQQSLQPSRKARSTS